MKAQKKDEKLIAPMIIYRRVEESDYESILALQNENFKDASALTEKDKQNGFLSAKFTKEQFKAMNADLGVVVAVKDNKVIGFVCGSSFAYCMQFQLLKETIDDINMQQRQVDHALMNAENTFFYGPVCIVKEERGQGILERLFDALRKIAINHDKKYTCCAFFMSPDNVRSFNAHQKRVGAKQIGSFYSPTRKREFYLLARTLSAPCLMATVATEMKGSGSKLYSGKISLWSFSKIVQQKTSNDMTTQVVEVSGNNAYRF